MRTDLLPDEAPFLREDANGFAARAGLLDTALSTHGYEVIRIDAIEAVA